MLPNLATPSQINFSLISFLRLLASSSIFYYILLIELQQLYFISLLKTAVGVNVSALSFDGTYFGTVDRVLPCWWWRICSSSNDRSGTRPSQRVDLWSSGTVCSTWQAPGIADITANDSPHGSNNGLVNSCWQRATDAHTLTRHRQRH